MKIKKYLSKSNDPELWEWWKVHKKTGYLDVRYNSETANDPPSFAKNYVLPDGRKLAVLQNVICMNFYNTILICEEKNTNDNS